MAVPVKTLHPDAVWNLVSILLDMDSGRRGKSAAALEKDAFGPSKVYHAGEWLGFDLGD